MGRIIIFDDGGGNDDSWIFGVLKFILYAVGIAIWPFLIKTITTTEDETSKKYLILFVVIVIVSCVVIAVIYKLIKKNAVVVKQANAFWTICIFTAIVTEIVVWCIDSPSEGEGGVLGVFIMCLFCSVVPSAIASVFCATGE